MSEQLHASSVMPVQNEFAIETMKLERGDERVDAGTPPGPRPLSRTPPGYVSFGHVETEIQSTSGVQQGTWMGQQLVSKLADLGHEEFKSFLAEARTNEQEVAALKKCRDKEQNVRPNRDIITKD